MQPIIPASLAEQAHHTHEQRAKIKLVLDFYREFVLECNFANQDRYLGPHYAQHNSQCEDGVEGLKKFAPMIREMSPNGYLKMHRALCDGDLVVTHSEARLDPAKSVECVYDMFRFENGKIVEHWDAIQSVPDTTASGNSPF